MYLLDTNIILEILLEQEHADEATAFLLAAQQSELYLSQFSLYSLGIILVRRKMYPVFMQTVNDLLITGGVRLVQIGLENIQRVIQTSRSLSLDFDDAYQYVIAELYDLTIVSFDADFDRTLRKRKTPAEVLDEIKPDAETDVQDKVE
jgi:predicted nucleic acid-binding protein